MYGLVNKAIQDLIVKEFGQDSWDKIRIRAKVDIISFTSMESYPDRITYDLVAAASDILKQPQAKLLEAFGEFWTIYTAREGYGDFFDIGGKTLKEFILNLNNLHTRVGTVFPHLKPPVFRSTSVTDHSLRLEYHSERPGLAPMVLGLIKGLGQIFNTEVSIQLISGRNENQKYDEFEVKYEPC